MTKIKFFKNSDKFVGFECSGHTGYGVRGKDILCATISGIVQSCQIGLTNILNIKCKISRDDESGYILVELPKDINDNKLRDAQILIETLYVSIIDLMEGYSKYISMEVIDYDF